jgi:hypothetical protein
VLLLTAVLLLRLLLRGGKVLRQREGLGIWVTVHGFAD